MSQADVNAPELEEKGQTTPNTVANMLEHDDPVVYARLMELMKK